MIYRKRGHVARWEHGTLIEIDEAGEAIEERGVFEARPLAAPAFSRRFDAEAAGVAAFANSVTRTARPERLVVSHGFAEHEANGVRWSEETCRVHLAIARKGVRALIDRADFELEDIARVAEAIHRIGSERDAPKRLRLAPSVTAALLPSLVGIAPPNVSLHQTGGGYDGNGREIADTPVLAPPWPNVFRPSYRIRPVSTPLNLRLEGDARVIDRALPEAVALLEPVQGRALRVLIVEKKRAYSATVHVVRIEAVGRDRTWYPYAAGAFGSEIML